MDETSTQHSDSSSVSVADITSRADLSILCEVYDENDMFLRSTFVYIDQNDSAWFGQARGIEKNDLTIEDIKALLERVPDHKIYPLAKPSISCIVDPKASRIFVKRPKLLCLDIEEQAEVIPQMILEEAEVLEYLKSSYHPSFVRYHGCIINHGRITGIALERHDVILQYRHEDDPRDFDIEACLERIQSGLLHLHSLGFAHNDINPMNIALDKDDKSVILDFGSCKRVGDQLTSAGTPGWMDESADQTVSSVKHDIAGLKRLESWLYGQEKEHRKQRSG